MSVREALLAVAVRLQEEHDRALRLEAERDWWRNAYIEDVVPDADSLRGLDGAAAKVGVAAVGGRERDTTTTEPDGS